jgi:hypothetical protein
LWSPEVPETGPGKHSAFPLARRAEVTIARITLNAVFSMLTDGMQEVGADKIHRVDVIEDGYYLIIRMDQHAGRRC